MCLILFAHKGHPRYPLILGANRDESYARPATAAGFWDEHPEVYGGRDLEKGGSWLGITRSGRIAAVTNFRDGNARRTAPRSRGELVRAFLASRVDPQSYLKEIEQRAGDYNGFILIAGTLDRLYWLSNRGPGAAQVPPGVHGLSNHLLDTPWPKIRRSKLALEALLDAGEAELVAGLFTILSDRSEAADHELPDTGVGIDRERQLSANFISGEGYGTRACSVVLVSDSGGVLFVERSFGPRGAPLGEVCNRFELDRTAISGTPPMSGQAAST